MSIEIIHIIDQLCREKGIDREILIDAIKTAVEAAARKKLPNAENLQGRFNEETGQFEILCEKKVVETVTDPETEIDLESAQRLIPEAELEDTVLVPQQLEDLGRIAAQLAKQVILQKVREAEIENVYAEYQDKKGDLINGIVQRFEHGDIIVDLGKAEGILPRREQVFRETFNRGDRVRAYVLDVRKTSKNALVILSRTHVGLIKRLFELEVPEISEGMVEIMGIVREPNGRTKIAVRTNDRDIDAVGACVGMRGMRVQAIVQELRGEKIDIVEYSEDPEIFIRNALSPAKISRIIANKDEKHMTIIVADDQMSLAIGKKGQNVRLAAKLVKWKIDIKGESEGHALAQTSDIFFKKAEPQEDFLEIIRTTKGFGEKIVALLFTNNIVSFQEVVNRGIEGLTKIQGIGPKKAEALLAFAQERLSQAPEAVEEPVPTQPVRKTVEDDSLVYTSPEIKAREDALSAISPPAGEETVAESAEEAPEETLEEAPEEALEETEEAGEEEEHGIEELKDVEPAIIALLQQNGFQTIAELSVASLDELIEIEGMDMDSARQVLEKAKQQMENYENA